jgi:hypothetical protein
MKKVTPEAYVEGVNSIYNQKPPCEYQEGHDGSDGKCDCIGMCRGGLDRAGATDVKNMRGTNQAARKALTNLQKLVAASLSLGDVVLKERDKDDKSMRLPDRYRKGGADYDPSVGETNFTHIGTVTQVNPLEITHMTSPTAKKDTSTKGWTWQAQLPWVDAEPVPPEPEQTAVVYAATGKTVNMRSAPKKGASLVVRVPIGETVDVLDVDDWCYIKWNGYKGYMMREFLLFESTLFTVVIPHLSNSQADALIMQYPDATKEEERG